ncbi:DUF2530 domain-containing protein [Marinactinospora thermotolerans]|uniref:DUF2530 domain-containing protein n=1 Tax=Marinactinospora thermotolerans DSM 45154 TaxID=1122192 RepID=A0A1T4MWQ1_9ACTN|nr:DUF2530 domain-containing protein [Marinactinospora thermotolerans]SJZ71276.1 Protein of unknown function [Marinactinospora thermotolerans DSM 45154]
MRKPRRPDPEVLEFDYRVPTALGSIGWTVALVVLLAMGDRLPLESRWWIWVCVTGIALGVFAYFYIPRLLRKRAEAEQRHAARRNAGSKPPASAAPAEGAGPSGTTSDAAP